MVHMIVKGEFEIQELNKAGKTIAIQKREAAIRFPTKQLMEDFFKIITIKKPRTKRLSGWGKMKENTKKHLKQVSESINNTTTQINLESLEYNTPAHYLYHCSCGYASNTFRQQLEHEEICMYKFTEQDLIETTPIDKTCKLSICDMCNNMQPRTIPCIGDCKHNLCFTCADIGREFNRVFNNKLNWKCDYCMNNSMKK